METKKVRLMYTGPKRKITVELPIPFVSRCEKRGEVVCDPIGEFSEEDAAALLDLPGADGLFRLADEEKQDAPAPVAPVAEEASAGWRSYTGAMKFKKANGLTGEIKYNKDKKRYEILETVSAVSG